jgi:O-antigen/teichoic acid export membrane protein
MAAALWCQAQWKQCLKRSKGGSLGSNALALGARLFASVSAFKGLSWVFLGSLRSLFSLFIIIVTTLFGKFIIIKLFGINYIEAYEPLKIHIWALLFVSISVIRNSKLFALGLSTIFFKITVIGALTNLILCYFLIKQYGIIGASLATVISYFIISYITNIMFKPLYSEFRNINNSFFNLLNFKK